MSKWARASRSIIDAVSRKGVADPYGIVSRASVGVSGLRAWIDLAPEDVVSCGGFKRIEVQL